MSDSDKVDAVLQWLFKLLLLLFFDLGFRKFATLVSDNLSVFLIVILSFK